MQVLPMVLPADRFFILVRIYCGSVAPDTRASTTNVDWSITHLLSVQFASCCKESGGLVEALIELSHHHPRISKQYALWPWSRAVVWFGLAVLFSSV